MVRLPLRRSSSDRASSFALFAKSGKADVSGPFNGCSPLALAKFASRDPAVEFG